MQDETNDQLNISKFVDFENCKLVFEVGQNQCHQLQPTGLDNPENDCYFNSAIQILSHIQQFKQYLESPYHQHTASKKSLFFTALKQFLTDILDKNQKSLPSNNLLARFRQCHPQDFPQNKPNDFRKLFKLILQDLRQVCKTCPNNTTIINLFIGDKKIKNQNKKQQANFSPFIEIQPQSQDLPIAMKNSVNSISKQTGFKQRIDKIVMESFPQILIFSVKYSPKQLTDTLVIPIPEHLFFLKNQMKQGLNADTNIQQQQILDYLQKILPLLRSVNNSASNQLEAASNQLKVAAQKFKAQAHKYDQFLNEYEVWGIVIYKYDQLSGTAHYKAFIKNQHDNKWYEYNDNIVIEIAKSRVKNLEDHELPYCVFYKRINKTNPIKITYVNKQNKKRQQLISLKIINDYFAKNWKIGTKKIKQMREAIDSLLKNAEKSKASISKDLNLKKIAPLFFYYSWVPLLFKLSQFKYEMENNNKIKKEKLTLLWKTEQAMKRLLDTDSQISQRKLDLLVKKIQNVAICIYCYEYYYYRKDNFAKSIKGYALISMMPIQQIQLIWKQGLSKIINKTQTENIRQFHKSQLKRKGPEILEAYQKLKASVTSKIVIQKKLKYVSANLMFQIMRDIFFIKGVGYYFYLTDEHFKTPQTAFQNEYYSKVLKQQLNEYFDNKSQESRLKVFKKWEQLKQKIDTTKVNKEDQGYQRMNQIMAGDFYFSEYCYEIELYYSNEITSQKAAQCISKRIIRIDQDFQQSRKNNPFSSRLEKNPKKSN